MDDKLIEELLNGFRNRFLGAQGDTCVIRFVAGLTGLMTLTPAEADAAWTAIIEDTAKYFHQLHELFYADDVAYSAAINEGMTANGYNNIPFIDYSAITGFTYNSNIADESTVGAEGLIRTFEAKPVYNSDNKETMKLSAIIAKKSRASEVKQEEIDYV